MRPPRLGRYLAPLALVAVIVATVLVVHSGLGTTPRPKPSLTTRLPAHRRHISRKRFYVIRPGDTLSSIAGKTGVSVGQLQTLNPSLTSNPNALQTGQRLRLR
jgi:Tfp pilus assembly protein FimV